MDAGEKKAVLRLFTYGLYVVTCRQGDERNGFTANWLTQVSFDPPLLAVSVENDALSLDLIRRVGEFAVCILKTGQRDLAGRLGRSRRRAPGKLDGVEWLPVDVASAEAAATTPPILADSLGYLRCALRSETPAGDSTLLIAEIVNAGLLQPGEPLTMHETGFRHAG